MPCRKPILHDTRAQRLTQVNALLVVISSHGRRFFRWEEHTARFMLSNGELLWVPGHPSAHVIAAKVLERSKRFHQGHTLRTLVVHLRAFIMHGTKLPTRALGPWPAGVCGGDLWGYGDEMQIVRDVAKSVSMIEEPSHAEAP